MQRGGYFEKLYFYFVAGKKCHTKKILYNICEGLGILRIFSMLLINGNGLGKQAILKVCRFLSRFIYPMF